MMAPVGQACWQGAVTQCLQTSLIRSQRPGVGSLLGNTSRESLGPDGEGAAAGVSGTGSRAGQGAAGTVGLRGGPPSRPAWTWQANALHSCMLTLGSATSDVRSLALQPTTSPAKAQWNGMPTWWTMRPSMR